MFQLLGTAFSAFASIQAGAAQRRAEEAQALQYEQEKRQNEIETLLTFKCLRLYILRHLANI